MVVRLFILIGIVSFSLLCRGQNPSYQRLGENELSGIDIYSICQTENKTIWMTSNRGVIKYDGYTFKFLNTSHLKAMSSFGIEENEQGELFCFNLFGQVLKIVDDSIQLYLQLPDSLVFNRYDMEIQSGARILLKSEKDILIHPDKSFEVVDDGLPKYSVDPTFKSTIEVHRVNEKEKSSYFYSPNMFLLFKWNGTEMIEHRMNREHIPISSVSHMVYRTRSNQFIFTLRNGGIYVFNENGRGLYNKEYLFKNYQISGFLEDYEGNLWLTTLGKGILLIENPDILSYRDHQLLKGKNIIVSKYRQDGDLFIGTESGEVFQIHRNNGQVEEVFSNGSVNIQFIEFYKDYLLSNGGLTIERIDLKKRISERIESIAAVKESRKINENEYLFATSKHAFHLKMNAQNRFETLNKYELGRCNAILPLDQPTQLLISSVKGLYSIQNGQQSEIQYENAKITSSGLEKYGSEIFIATTTKGIYLYENGKIKNTLTTKDGLYSNRIEQIQASGKILYIATSEGLQAYDMRNKTFILPHLKNTINGSRIIYFSVFKKELFVVTNKDLQIFRIDQLREHKVPPHIEFSSVFVNDDRIDNGLTKKLRYNQNKLEFSFLAKSYGHRNKLVYHYRLLPVDSKWETADFSNNRVKYASLSPGKYTFEVKATNEYGVESEVIQYEFEIKEPFWESWWFYTLIFLVLLTLTVFIWKRQLNRIQEKNEREKELIGSQLTALKLQMNPHFIFNALNSIQDLILKEDTENSYDYIVKFSNLVRRILNYSDKDFIELQEEMEILQLYLELEELRFKENFQFEIQNQIQKDLKIPSMLIQPFVENSVKHGLLHKEGLKKIKITFELQDVVVCTIEDNGVGISKSKEINARKVHKPESVSIKSIQKRMNILRNYYQSEIGIEFIDLTDAKGGASGTKVVLRLPYENN